MRFTLLLAAAALTAPAAAQTGTAPLPQTTPTTSPSPAATPTATPDAQPTAGAPAATPVPIPPTVGATVYGVAGTPVGTIKDMNSQFVTLSTAKGDVRLPAAGVGPGLKGPVIGLTAAELDAAVAQAHAAQRSTTAGADTATTSKTTTTTKRTRKPRRR